MTAGAWSDLDAAPLMARLQHRHGLRASYEGGALEVLCPRCAAWPDYFCVEGREDVGPHAERQVAAATRREELAQAKRRRQEDELRRRLVVADVPELHVRFLLHGQIREDEALQVTRSWWSRKLATLILVGARGIGKSLAAAWAVSEGPHHRPAGRADARWWVASELSGLDFYGEARLEEAHRCGLLVVDDVGMGELGEARRFWTRLETALNVRHDRALQTIVTCNMSIDEFRSVCDERVRDRIKASGLVHSCITTRSLRTGREAGE